MKKLIQVARTHTNEDFLDETIMELQSVEGGEFHVYDEYLIEVVKQSRGRKYYTRLYKLVAKGSPCKDQDSALEESISFVKLRR